MDSEPLPIIDFSKVRKKKIVKVVKPIEGEDLSNIVIDKKKQVTKEEKTIEEETIESISNIQNMSNEYTYDYLLDRISKLIKLHNPDSTTGGGMIKMPVPIVNMVGKSRASWVNFFDFFKALNRPQEHLFQYVLGELGVQGTIGGENQLLLKSRVNKNQIESILRKYIHDYVQCPNCKSFKTIIKKDVSTRLQQIFCENCKTLKTIQHLKVSVKGK